MSDPNRPTVESATMIDAHKEQPRNGQTVWALGRGGCAVQTTWNSESINFFEAWYPSLKVPQSVKDRMRDYYKPKEQHATDEDKRAGTAELQAHGLGVHNTV